MEDTFIITEAKSIRGAQSEDLVSVYRSRWALEKRVEALEAEVREQTAIAQELRERLATVDYQQRELLKGVAKVVEDCDDTLQIELSRLEGVVPDDPEVRHSRKWRRRVERIRTNLSACLGAYGISMRAPTGAPDPALDRIHSAVNTAAVPPGHVAEVLRSGLLWNGSLLRYSLVVVAAPPETAPGVHDGNESPAPSVNLPQQS